jgi:hypothetical protein
MTSDIKQELGAEVRPKGNEGFGVFLVRVGDDVVIDCVAEYNGSLAYEGACRQAARSEAPWISNVPGDLPQAQSNLTETPFMTTVGGHVLIHDGVTAAPLAETWTGVCCDSSVKSFWYIGREQNERSFNKLKARPRSGSGGAGSGDVDAIGGALSRVAVADPSVFGAVPER